MPTVVEKKEKKLLQQISVPHKSFLTTFDSLELEQFFFLFPILSTCKGISGLTDRTPFCLACIGFP